MQVRLTAFATSLIALFISASASAHGFCARYENNTNYLNAIKTVASRMQYKPLELCTLPTLADIYVQPLNITEPQSGEIIPHTWVTLHYNEYSCQYFVKNLDQSVTKSNCYNTW